MFTSEFDALIRYMQGFCSKDGAFAENGILQVDFEDESAFLNYLIKGEDRISHALMCRFSDNGKTLGVLVLNRTPQQGRFTDEELLMIRLLEPHISYCWNHIARQGKAGFIQSDMLFDEYRLTRREMEIVSCVAFGMSISEISLKLSISPSTVKKHLEHIYKKTGVNNRMSLMRLAQQYVS